MPARYFHHLSLKYKADWNYQKLDKNKLGFVELKGKSQVWNSFNLRHFVNLWRYSQFNIVYKFCWQLQLQVFVYFTFRPQRQCLQSSIEAIENINYWWFPGCIIQSHVTKKQPWKVVKWKCSTKNYFFFLPNGIVLAPAIYISL